MLLRVPAVTSIAVSSLQYQDAFKDKVVGNHSLSQLSYQRQKRDLFSIRAMNVETNSKPVTGVIFEPFSEVQNELVQVSEDYTQSFAHQRFDDAYEAALNEQINVEYNVSYVYHAMFAYSDRDSIGLPGFAKYSKDASDEERDHAVKLIEYQNIRGGKVKLQSILMPVMEFDHAEKGDALYAMELALSLEKLNNERLFRLHSVAAQCNDAQMTDFIEGNFLAKQVDDIKKVSEYVAQLRRIGNETDSSSTVKHGNGELHLYPVTVKGPCGEKLELQINPGDSVMDLRQFLLDTPETYFYTCYDLIMVMKDGFRHQLADYFEIGDVGDITT